MPVGGTAFFGMNQHPRITTTYLNQLSRHGDPAPGLNVGGRTDFVNGGQVGFSGQIAQPYAGFNGLKWTVTNPWATQFADPSVGPLYGGIYQYLELDPDATANITRGSIVFWLDELQYIVSADSTNAVTGAPNKVAGVAVAATAPEHWDFFQIAGIAMVMMDGAGTVGQSALVTPGTPPTVTAGAPGPTAIGTIVFTPAVASQVGPVELNIPVGYNF